MTYMEYTRLTCTAAWPAGILDNATYSNPEIARKALHLIIRSGDWIHRRVESVSFLNARTMTRRVSVDFTVPLQTPWVELADQRRAALLPLGVIRRGDFTNFDLRDEAGHARSLLQLQQLTRLDQTILAECARRTLSCEPEPPGLIDEAAGLPEFMGKEGGQVADCNDLRAIYRQWMYGDPWTEENGFRTDPRYWVDKVALLNLATRSQSQYETYGGSIFLAVTRHIARNIHVYALLEDATPLQHRIIKYSYERPVEWFDESPGESDEPAEGKMTPAVRSADSEPVRARDTIELLRDVQGSNVVSVTDCQRALESAKSQLAGTTQDRKSAHQDPELAPKDSEQTSQGAVSPDEAAKFKAAEILAKGTLGRLGLWRTCGVCWDTVRAKLGWFAPVFVMPACSAVYGRSYHFEATVPEGLVVTGAELRDEKPPEQGETTTASQPDGKTETPTDKEADAAPRNNTLTAVTSVNARTVDLHIIGAQLGAQVRARIALAPERRGWLSLSCVASSVISAVLVLVAARLRDLTDQNPNAKTPTGGWNPASLIPLFLASVTILFALLMRPNEYGFPTILLKPTRRLLTFTTVLPIAYGVVLSLWWWEDWIHDAAWWVAGLAIASTLLQFSVLWMAASSKNAYHGWKPRKPPPSPFGRKPAWAARTEFKLGPCRYHDDEWCDVQDIEKWADELDERVIADRFILLRVPGPR